MNPVHNPFVPGAGPYPPTLGGRQVILEEARIAIARASAGRQARAQMYLGLRAMGKTALLNHAGNLARQAGHLVSTIEATANASIGEQLIPQLQQVLRKLSIIESASDQANAASLALKSFARSLKAGHGELSIGVEHGTGVADSGDLEIDLPDLFVLMGQAAMAAGTVWTLMVDEIERRSDKELTALIAALHRTSQLGLPVLFFGAGLPQVAAMSGEAKSYAERLFQYWSVGCLSEEETKTAFREPFARENVFVSEDILSELFLKTRGYPYFVQVWAYEIWNLAEGNSITTGNIKDAELVILRRLDDGFFRPRLARLTPKERDYVMAMASLGKGPYRSSDIASVLGETVQSLGPRRAQIIIKGIIYSPSHGDIDFTVPMFDDYLIRNMSD